MTTEKKEKIKIPAALSMMLKSFGIDAEKAQSVANDFISQADVFLAAGSLEKIFNIVETVERIELKLDAILERLEKNG